VDYITVATNFLFCIQTIHAVLMATVTFGRFLFKRVSAALKKRKEQSRARAENTAMLSAFSTALMQEEGLGEELLLMTVDRERPIDDEDLFDLDL